MQTCSRLRVPFGVAQIGKAFRNEVTTRNFIFRSREFEQMEMEFFVAPEEEDKWYEFWSQARYDWYVRLGIAPERLRMRPHEKDELAHYARCCVDVEYQFPFGWNELEGIANRGDFDLSQHIKFSNKDLSYRDDLSGRKFVPSVIEASAGVRLSREELERTANRITQATRRFNAREGIGPEADTLPPRILNERTLEGAGISASELKTMTDEYNGLREGRND